RPGQFRSRPVFQPQRHGSGLQQLDQSIRIVRRGPAFDYGAMVRRQRRAPRPADHPARRSGHSGERFREIIRALSWRTGTVYTPINGLAFYGQYSTAVDPVSNLITLTLPNKDF